MHAVLAYVSEDTLPRYSNEDREKTLKVHLEKNVIFTLASAAQAY